MWGHVDGSAYKGPGHLTSLPKELSEPKIAYFERLFIDENVGWFEVSMNNPESDHLLKAFDDLCDNFIGRFFVDFAGGAVTLQIAP